ncbi:hypothetical protein D1007_22499 [Hordeum vulgare]|nr:hypothetical protein D1007_22499 [Hordeum vulgare]
MDAAVFIKIKLFYSNIVKRLAPPLFREVQASSLHADAEPFTSKRATRSSKRAGTASSGPTKPKPVENVLLKMLGQGPEDMVPDDAAVHELRALFDSPLREQHIRVIAVLFDKTVPPQQEMVAGESTTISVV